eukprot:gene4098-5127_t
MIFSRKSIQQALGSVILYFDRNYYFRLHFIYFIVVGFIGGCIITATEARHSRPAFIDSLFLSYSAITNTGLITVDISKLSAVTQSIVMILMQLGSAVILTIPIIVIRRYYLRRAYQNRSVLTPTDRDSLGVSDHDNDHDHSDEEYNYSFSKSYQNEKHEPIVSGSIITTTPTLTTVITTTVNTGGDSSISSSSSGVEGGADQSISIPLTSTLEGNIEYRSLGKLLVIVPLYQVLIYIVAFFFMGIYSSTNENAHNIMVKNQVNGWWWSLFGTISSFNNVGITLFSGNMVPFNHTPYYLLMVSLLVALGNTLFPVFLRLIITIGKRVSKDKEPYINLLENPRSCYTHLFQAKQTMVLLIVWFIFNVSQIGLMAILETNDKAFEGMKPSVTFLNYLFQSVVTRTGGFNSIDVSLLSDSVLLLFVGLMFVSSYPFVISLRQTAVNGKYSTIDANRSREVMKDLLIRDLFILYICILIITIIEESRLDLQSPSFSVFHIIFEVVSGFGTVGLSIGYPGIPYSFSGTLKNGSKFFIIVVMILGKHRGLPDSVDNAVSLEEFSPLSHLFKKYNQKRKSYY